MNDKSNSSRTTPRDVVGQSFRVRGRGSFSLPGSNNEVEV